MYSISCMAVIVCVATDPRIPALPGRSSTSGFHTDQAKSSHYTVDHAFPFRDGEQTSYLHIIPNLLLLDTGDGNRLPMRTRCILTTYRYRTTLRQEAVGQNIAVAQT